MSSFKLTLKKLSINVLLVGSAVLASLILGEVSLRTYLFMKPKTYYIDHKLGWRATENYHYEGLLKDAGGEQYYAKVTTDSHGSRLFGNPESDKIKVLVVGDSFTYAKDVGDEYTYYHLLAKKAKNMEFFVYGVIGYSTLQELMIIDELIDTIRPQIIILQFCYNDFFDNDDSVDFNRTMDRPYIDLQGNIFYKKRPFILSILVNHSLLVRYAFAYLEKFPDAHVVKSDIEKSSGNSDAFRKASIKTKIIMQKIKIRASGAMILAFNANETQPYNAEFNKIVLSENIKLVDGVTQAIKAYEQKGFSTRAADLDHWNELGHKIVADKIYNYLFDHGYLQIPTPQIIEPRQPEGSRGIISDRDNPHGL